VKRHFYRERDYAFGQMILTLRTSLGLTQVRLADHLSVSRRSVAEWEAGSNSPKAECLKELITLGCEPQLLPPGATPVIHTAASPSVDLLEALDVSHFTGREVEVAELSQWILEERNGVGGIGKSVLASYLGSCLAPHFEAVLWRSVRDAPPCEELVADCLTFFSQTPLAAFPSSLEQRITQLVTRLKASRCLLVLDNLEVLHSEGDGENIARFHPLHI